MEVLRIFILLVFMIPSSIFAQKVGSIAPELTLEKVFNYHQEGIPSLESLKGKVVVINFWATWCKHCVADFPKYNLLCDKYSEKDFEFIAISSESTDILEKFLNNQTCNFIIGVDADGKDSRNYKIWYRPYSVIIDKTGIIIYRGNQLKEEFIEKALIQ